MSEKEVAFAFALLFGFLTYQLVKFDKNILIFLKSEIERSVKEGCDCFELIMFMVGVAGALFLTIVSAICTYTLVGVII